MRVLIVNAGSSSLKLRLLDDRDRLTGVLDLDPWHGEAGVPQLAAFVAGLGGVDAVGHRVVHGGHRFTGATLIDAGVRSVLAGFIDLAPLHQARSLAAVDAVQGLLAGVPAVACFDTAFHASLPPAAATYALPAGWRARFGLRRFGFHGLSHAYAARRAAELVSPGAGQRMVVCHLGAGASLAAVLGGRCVDTTMGFTPMEGLVMATRPGNLDPGLLLWLLRRGGLTLPEVTDELEHEAGLAGLAELGSGDMRDVRRAARSGHAPARLALEVYVHRLRREIAAMTAALGGLDVLVFTGGVGEHDPAVRDETAAGLGFLGVGIDPGRNAAASADAEITAAGASARVFVVTAREDLEMARQVRALLGGVVA